MLKQGFAKVQNGLLCLALVLVSPAGAFATPPQGRDCQLGAKSCNHPTHKLPMREESLTLLKDLVAINSGTSNSDGQSAMRRRLIPAFEALGLVATEYTVTGGHKVLSFETNGAKPRVLLVGHTDTVFNNPASEGRLLVDGVKLKGPGVIDMKGGIVLILEVLRDLKESGHDEALRSLRVVLNDDEETGSGASRDTLKKLAAGCEAALIFEPGLPQGALVTAHAGVRWLKLTVHGKAAHAGLEPRSGLNACVELGHKLVELDALSDFSRHLTVNPGVIEGGAAPNVICETASVKVDLRYTRQEDLADTLTKINRIGSSGHVVNEKLGLTTSAEVAELAAMPPMPEAATRQLFELARAAGTTLGQRIDGEAVGYASDGNTLASTGIALLVGLGPYGGGMHTADEFMLAQSFADRAALSRDLILKIARTERLR